MSPFRHRARAGWQAWNWLVGSNNALCNFGFGEIMRWAWRSDPVFKEAPNRSCFFPGHCIAFGREKMEKKMCVIGDKGPYF